MRPYDSSDSSDDEVDVVSRGSKMREEDEEKYGLGLLAHDSEDDDDGNGHSETFGEADDFGEKGKYSEKEKDKETIENICKQLSEMELDMGSFTPPPIYLGTLEGKKIGDLVEILKNAYNRWFGEETKKMNFYALSHYVFGFNKLSNDKYNERLVDSVYARLHLELINLNIAFEHMGIMGAKEAISIDYQRKINRMYETLYNARHMLCYAMRGENLRDTKRCNADPDKYDLFRFQAFNPSDLKSFERLLLFIQRRAAERGYRKMGDNLYEEHKVWCYPEHGSYKSGGPEHVDPNDPKSEKKEYGTYSWRSVGSIRQFIIRECNPRTNFDMWRDMLDKNNLEKVIKHIEDNSEDEQIPDLKRNRTITAWRNGLWFADYAAFYHYSRGRLPKEVVACQFIDQEFDNTDYGDDFMDIPCVVRKILGDQNYTKEEQSFVLGVAFGRLIFEPGKYDRWEIIPFLWGLAGTGKSSLIDACIKLFDQMDVHTVGNNFEKQFGLQDIYDKMLWACHDVKKSFSLDAGDLQMMTSQDRMSVSRKYKGSVSLQWKVQAIIGGNEIPRSWTDSLGALERRILIVDFPNMVTRDNQVKLDLENQRSLFYRLITYAYHYWQRKCGAKNIWDYAPDRFRKARKIVTEHENPLEMFLNSTDIEITRCPADYVRQDVVVAEFKRWCVTWGQRHKLDNTELKNKLASRGVKHKFTEEVWPLGQKEGTPIGGPDGGKMVEKKEKIKVTDHFYYGIKIIKRAAPGAAPPPGSTGGNFNRLSRAAAAY